MSNLPKPFLYGLLLCGVALTGFTCWGIYSVVTILEPVAIQANSTLATVDTAGQHLITLESQLNVQVQQDAPKVTAILSNAQTASANLSKASAGLNKAITEINQPCGKGHPCGTIAELNEAIRAFHQAIGFVEIAAKHEDANLTTIDQQEATLYGEAASSMTKLGDALGGFAKAESALEDLINNKDLKTSLANLSSVTNSLSSMGKEATQAVHDFFHPTWVHRIISGGEEVLTTAGKFFLP